MWKYGRLIVRNDENKWEELSVWHSGHMGHLKKHMLCLKEEEVAIFQKRNSVCEKIKKGTCFFYEQQLKSMERGLNHGKPGVPLEHQLSFPLCKIIFPENTSHFFSRHILKG